MVYYGSNVLLSFLEQDPCLQSTNSLHHRISDAYQLIMMVYASIHGCSPSFILAAYHQRLYFHLYLISSLFHLYQIIIIPPKEKSQQLGV